MRPAIGAKVIVTPGMKISPWSRFGLDWSRGRGGWFGIWKHPPAVRRSLSPGRTMTSTGRSARSGRR